MSLLLLLAVAVAVVAVLSLVHAVTRAESGYEDEHGFHSVSPAPQPARSARGEVHPARAGNAKRSAPTYAPVAVFGPL